VTTVCQCFAFLHKASASRWPYDFLALRDLIVYELNWWSSWRPQGGGPKFFKNYEQILLPTIAPGDSSISLIYCPVNLAIRSDAMLRQLFSSIIPSTNPFLIPGLSEYYDIDHLWGSCFQRHLDINHPTKSVRCVEAVPICTQSRTLWASAICINQSDLENEPVRYDRGTWSMETLNDIWPGLSEGPRDQRRHETFTSITWVCARMNLV
jgi:hypothetical protein